MNVARRLLGVIIAIAVGRPSLAIQPVDAEVRPELDRVAVQRQLAEAERARARFRILTEAIYIKGDRPPPGQRSRFARLSAGDGRYRTTHEYAATEQRDRPVTAVRTWDRTERRNRQFLTEATEEPNTLGIIEQASRNDHLDGIEQALGLRIERARISPSELLDDPSIEATIRPARIGDLDLVSVRFPDPPQSPLSTLTFHYDPERDWFLVGWEESFSGLEDPGDPDSEPIVVVRMTHRVTQAEEIDGVWMPRRVESEQVFSVNRPDERRVTTVLDFLEIDRSPVFDDDDFTIAVEDLPEGSSIVDNRLGASYRLGDNAIVVDGILHEVARPITHELTAREFADLMSSAQAHVDPRLADDADLEGPRGSGWLEPVGYGLLILGATSCTIVVLRRRLTRP